MRTDQLHDWKIDAPACRSVAVGHFPIEQAERGKGPRAAGNPVAGPLRDGRPRYRWRPIDDKLSGPPASFGRGGDNCGYGPFQRFDGRRRNFSGDHVRQYMECRPECERGRQYSARQRPLCRELELCRSSAES
jgi:hypothetical protein